jgi:hypothetical protein
MIEFKQLISDSNVSNYNNKMGASGSAAEIKNILPVVNDNSRMKNASSLPSLKLHESPIRFIEQPA